MTALQSAIVTRAATDAGGAAGRAIRARQAALWPTADRTGRPVGLERTRRADVVRTRRLSGAGP